MKASKVFKVTGTKFNLPYDDKYQVKTSAEYNCIAAEYENVFHLSVCKRIASCVAIKVADVSKGSITVDYDVSKGSIQVDYDVIVDAWDVNVTTAVVQNVSQAALDDPLLKVFRPDPTALPSTQGKRFMITFLQ